MPEMSIKNTHHPASAQSKPVSEGAKLSPHPESTAEGSFELTHPKNYLGVPVAVSMDTPVEIVIPKRLVRMAGETRTGAENLGLITRDCQLTQVGHQYVDAVINAYGSVSDGFDVIADSTQSRFINATPEIVSETQLVFAQYPATVELIQLLNANGRLSLTELASKAQSVEKSNLQACLFTASSTPEADARRTDYNSLFTYQFKSLLCHCGILTTPGSDTNSLSPDDDMWALSPHLDAQIKEWALGATVEGVWE